MAAQATPSTPVTDDCWSCGFDQSDTSYDYSGFAGDNMGSWPYYERPRRFYPGEGWPGLFRSRGRYGAGWNWRGWARGRGYAPLSLESQVYTLTNDERDREQCPELRLDYALMRAARSHSRDMAAYRYMSHTDYNNEDPAERMAESGYPVRYGWAENIAYGSSTAGQVMYAWMTSPGHRKNILDCNLRAIGVGVARAQDGTLYWTQNFGGR
jgi:uncharacterized protein YkwD